MVHHESGKDLVKSTRTMSQHQFHPQENLLWWIRKLVHDDLTIRDSTLGIWVCAFGMCHRFPIEFSLIHQHLKSHFAKWDFRCWWIKENSIGNRWHIPNAQTQIPKVLSRIVKSSCTSFRIHQRRFSWGWNWCWLIVLVDFTRSFPDSWCTMNPEKI